jgi:hypothetical protein
MCRQIKLTRMKGHYPHNMGLKIVELTELIELLRNVRMKSDSTGTGTSAVEILNVSPHGAGKVAPAGRRSSA